MKNTLLFLASTLLLTSTANAFNPKELVAQNDNDYARFLVGEFQKFPASRVRTFVKPVPVIKKGTAAYKFRTEIRRQFKKDGINFAGKWGLVTVGCGTACSHFFLIDGVSGEVKDPNLTAENGNAYWDDQSHLLYVGPGSFKSYDEAKNAAGGTPKAWIEKDGALEPYELNFIAK